MKYYLVRCKHGHVGRDKYLPLNIPIAAESVEAAIKIARNKLGVKQDHPDWCLAKPTILTAEEYTQAKEIYYNHQYFKKRTRQNLDLFENELVKEPNYTSRNGFKTNKKLYLKKENLSDYKVKKNKELKKSQLKTKHNWEIE